MTSNQYLYAVIPCFNEEDHIISYLEKIKNLIGNIVVIDDKSTDTTNIILKKYIDENKKYKIILLEHKVNAGVGAAIATGYKYIRDVLNPSENSAVVVLAGDGQMPVDQLDLVTKPIFKKLCDVSKVNRLGKKSGNIPIKRLIGNKVLSLLTQIASGYYGLWDSQTGYVAINVKVLKEINWDQMYKRYGQPNDFIMKCSEKNYLIYETDVKPYYRNDIVSKMKVYKVVLPILSILIKGFFKRAFRQYFIENLHPIILSLIFSIFFFALDVIMFSRMMFQYFMHNYIGTNSLIIFFSLLLLSILLMINFFKYDYNNKKLKIIKKN